MQHSPLALDQDMTRTCLTCRKLNPTIKYQQLHHFFQGSIEKTTYMGAIYMSSSKKNELFEEKYFCGHRKDSSSWFLSMQRISSYKHIPLKGVTSVCGILQPSEDTIVAVLNKRGIDIPGGHVEKGETPLEALVRECKEEAYAELFNVKPIALLSSDFDPDKETFIVLFKAKCILQPFNPTEEINARFVMNPDDFLKNYYGNKLLMEKLLKQQIKATQD